MTVHTLVRQTRLPRPIDRVFDFFSYAENLERLTPASLRFRILNRGPVEMREGALIEYKLRLRGLPIRWLTRIEEWNPPHQFVDVQLRGPYRLWHHTHTFAASGEETDMTDTVRYALPFGPLGELAHHLFVARELRSIFDYRAAKILDALGGR